MNRNGSWALMCMDLDGFKLVNDTFGHACGDMVLVEFADRAMRVMPNPRPGGMRRLYSSETRDISRAQLTARQA